VTPESPPATVRVAEVLAALSLATDLARGHPPEEAMRACLLAMHVGRSIGLADSDLTDAYYATLLRYVGCTATSTDYAEGFAGDDVDVRRAGDLIDATVPSEVLGFLWSLSRRAGAARPLQFARMLSHGAAVAQAGAAADCEVGARLVSRFGCSPAVETALRHSFERWDGRGAPHGVSGEAIPLAARLATLGFVAVMFDAVADRRAATNTGMIWHAQRLGQLGGDHIGWPAVADFFGRTMQLTRGTFHIEVLEVLTNATGGAVVVQSMGARDGMQLNDRQVHLFHLEDGRVVEVWHFVGDGPATEEFWG
jgi:ketosteroid isomerase-like protein